MVSYRLNTTQCHSHSIIMLVCSDVTFLISSSASLHHYIMVMPLLKFIIISAFFIWVDKINKNWSLMKDNQKILKCILFQSMYSLVQIKRSIIYVVLKQTQISTWSFIKWQIVSYHQEFWTLRTIDWPEALTGKD